MAAPQRRDLPPLEEGFYFYFFFSLSLSFSYLSYGALFCPPCGSLWLACAVICATERVGYLIKIGLFSCIPVHALPEKTLSPLAHSLSFSFSLFVGFRPWRVIDSALRYPPPDTWLRGIFLRTFRSSTPFFGNRIPPRESREKGYREQDQDRFHDGRFTGDRVLTLRARFCDSFSSLILCTIVKNVAR